MSGMPYVNTAGVFLVETLFGFYILAVMLRFLLQWARADFYNPLVQFLVKLTNPALIPLRRAIPGLMGLDMAAIVLMLGLKVLELLLVVSMSGHSAGLTGLSVLAVGELFGLLIDIFFWAVIIQAVTSWFSPDPRHPAVSLLHQLTYPILRPARSLIPLVSGLDLSPILVIIVLQLIKLLLVAPLRDTGLSLILGA
jgi:YggT family protein